MSVDDMSVDEKPVD
jgi:hypothetical protein